MEWDYAYMKLNRLGTEVRAKRTIPYGPIVPRGTRGFVTEEINEHGDGTGFLVQWPQGFCNVYPGDVELG